MFQYTGQPIDFVVLFAKAGAPFTPGGGVASSVVRIRLDTGATEPVASAAVATSEGAGIFRLRVTDTEVAGTYFATFVSADATVDNPVQSSTWFVGLPWVQATALIGALSTTEPDPESFARFDVALLAETDVRFAQTIVIPGRDISGWTSLVFTVKRSPDADLDADAILTVRVSNPPAAGTDGIVIHRGRPVDPADPLRIAGTLAVLSVTPDTTATVTIVAAGMDIPPAPENEPYTYEVDVWRTATAGDKEQIGKGNFAVKQSVRRSVVIP